MTDLDKAKELLHTLNCSCALCCKDKQYISHKPGIAPMLEFIESGVDLKGFSAADKIIGKAAALLFIAAGVKEVYGETVSLSAIKELSENGVICTYGEKTDFIVNRSGDGMCPMENTVKDIESPLIAVKLLREKLDLLRKNRS